jgi:aldehyde dehydrogenase (NAD+)
MGNPSPGARLASESPLTLQHPLIKSLSYVATDMDAPLPAQTTSPQIRDTLKNAFRTGRTKSIQFRKQQLLGLAYLIKDNLARFEQALASDLGRSSAESIVYAPSLSLLAPGSHSYYSSSIEIGGTLSEAVDAYHNVAKWSKPESARWSFNFFAMKPTILKRPKGVVLIISPFNYPMWLLLGPLVRGHRALSDLSPNASFQAGAIAAGNACALKPSELTPAFSALLAELLPNYLDPELYTVINGAIPETTKVSYLLQ